MLGLVRLIYIFEFLNEINKMNAFLKSGKLGGNVQAESSTKRSKKIERAVPWVEK